MFRPPNTAISRSFKPSYSSSVMPFQSAPRSSPIAFPLPSALRALKRCLKSRSSCFSSQRCFSSEREYIRQRKWCDRKSLRRSSASCASSQCRSGRYCTSSLSIAAFISSRFRPMACARSMPVSTFLRSTEKRSNSSIEISPSGLPAYSCTVFSTRCRFPPPPNVGVHMAKPN